MREYGVRNCECGNVWLGGSTRELWKDGGCLRDDDFFCSSCGMKLGIDEEGPWREAMVPRAALEWLAEQCNECPDLPGHECPMKGVANEDMPEGACYKCLCDAALKAAEETADE